MITPALQSHSHVFGQMQPAELKQNVAHEAVRHLTPSSLDQKDITLLREGLRGAETPDQLREAVDAFLSEPEESPTEEFAVLMRAKRKGVHPLHDRIDRLNTAVSEIRLARGGYSDQDMIVASNQMLRDLQLEIEMIQDRIEQEIVNSFLKEAEE